MTGVATSVSLACMGQMGVETLQVGTHGVMGCSLYFTCLHGLAGSIVVCLSCDTQGERSTAFSWCLYLGTHSVTSHVTL
jgi:hypothetical protein